MIGYVALGVILGLSITMSLSCYPDGIFGWLAFLCMSLGAVMILTDAGAYSLSSPTQLILFGAALFQVRHFLRFQKFRNRQGAEL
jgi:hypothetical protein